MSFFHGQVTDGIEIIIWGSSLAWWEKIYIMASILDIWQYHRFSCISFDGLAAESHVCQITTQV